MERFGTLRDTHSIQRKFADLYCRKEPTGNPNIPAEVQYAKQIRECIKSSTQIVDDISDIDMDNNEVQIDNSTSDVADESGDNNKMVGGTTFLEVNTTTSDNGLSLKSPSFAA